MEDFYFAFLLTSPEKKTVKHRRQKKKLQSAVFPRSFNNAHIHPTTLCFFLFFRVNKREKEGLTSIFLDGATFYIFPSYMLDKQ